MTALRVRVIPYLRSQLGTMGDRLDKREYCLRPVGLFNDGSYNYLSWNHCNRGY